MKFYILRKKSPFSRTSFHHDQGNGYDVNDEKTFGAMLAQAKYKEQIVIRLNANRDVIHYLYVREIGRGWLGIGIKQTEVCKDLGDLFFMFEDLIDKILKWPQPILIKGNHAKGQLSFTNRSIDREKEEIMMFKSEYDSYIDEPFLSAIRLSSFSPMGNGFKTEFERTLDEIGTDSIIPLIEKGCQNLLIIRNKSQRIKTRRTKCCLAAFLILIALLSTILTIYGLCGGFSPDIVDESGNVQTVNEKTIVPENENTQLVSKPTTVIRANDTSPKAETLPQRNDSVNNEVDSSKIAPVVAGPIKEKDVTAPEPVAKPLTQKERFENAKRVKDWEGMRWLADEGYTPAYLPLARHYMNNSRQHGLAKKYAEKAKRAGIAGATEILNELEDLDY